MAPMKIIGLLVLVVGGSVVPSNTSELMVTDDERSCVLGSECVVIPNACPGEHAGSRLAVHQDFVESIDSRRPILACQLVPSSDPTCDSSRADCIAGLCELVVP